MFCTQCREEKLRREFPSRTLTDKCNHAPLHCLRVSLRTKPNKYAVDQDHKVVYKAKFQATFFLKRPIPR